MDPQKVLPDLPLLVTCHYNSRVPVSDFQMVVPSSLLQVEDLAVTLAHKKHLAKGRIILSLQGERLESGEWLFLDTNQVLQFSVLPPAPDRKRRKRRKAPSTPPSDELAHELLREFMSPNKIVPVCTTRLVDEPHVLTAHIGGARTADSAQWTFDPDLAQRRKRPFPFGDTFDNVMVFPDPDLRKFIDATTYYVVQSGKRHAFEQRVKATFGKKAAFMEKDNGLYPFYMAYIRFHVQYNPPQVLRANLVVPAHDEDEVIVVSSTPAVPQAKKQKTSPCSPDLRIAVRGVFQRRCKAGILTHIPYETVVREAMQCKPLLQPTHTSSLPLKSRSLTPKQKAMPRPKVTLSPALRKPDIPPLTKTEVPFSGDPSLAPCSSSLWKKYIHPWTSHPDSLGGMMKIPAPIDYVLGQFAKHAVEALMVLLKTRVIFVARRSQEPYIRVRYVKDALASLHPRALTLCQTLEEFHLFYAILDDLAANIIMYDYHEFLLKAEGGLDHIFNYWTTTPRVKRP
eukprot:3180085-Amphidinium_carterae.2